MPHVYEVEKPFPDARYNIHMEGGCIRFLDAGFDVLLIMNDIDSVDLELFASDNFRYGLFTAQFIPFLMIDLDSALQLECSFNFFKLTREQATQWLQTDSNLLTFYLIEQRGFILKGIKTVTLPEALNRSLRETLAGQIENYERSEQVDFQISIITRQYSIEEMLKHI